MSTSGTFEMSGFQGNFEEDTDELSSQAEELGESQSRSQRSKVHIRRNDKGLFQLTVNASRSQIEEIKNSIEAMLAKNQSKALAGGKLSGFDWTQCQSEGGSKNCALCSDQEGGALSCPKVAVTGQHTGTFCPD